MMAEKDFPGGRVQMLWKPNKTKTRQLQPLKSFAFQSDDEEEDEGGTGVDAASNDNDKRPAKEVEGERPTGTAAQAESQGVRESREELEHSQQAERMLNEGNSLAEEGRFGEALGKWETAIYLTPRRALLHEQKAQVLLEIGKSWSAVQAATCATELQPTWAEAWVTLARAQLNYGEPGLAVDSAQTALRLEPGHTEASRELERAQFLAIRQHQAIRESTALNLSGLGLQSDRDSSLPSFRRARVYDSQDFSFGVEHPRMSDREPEAEEKEDKNFDKYDDDTYDWVDDIRRPAPEITTENLMSDFSDIL